MKNVLLILMCGMLFTACQSAFSSPIRNKLVTNEDINARLFDSKQFSQSLAMEKSFNIIPGLNSISISEEVIATIEVSSNEQRQEYSDLAPASKKAGEVFILIYVVFSLLAGVKEFATRFKKRMENRENDEN